jgi:murein DD-endopeptidase MepM/ murein hydrolase activator NlpD
MFWFGSEEKTLVSRTILIPDELLGSSKVVTVKSGDNFSLVAKRADLSGREVFNIMESGDAAKKLLDLRPKQKIIFNFDKLNNFIALSYPLSVNETLLVTKDKEGFKSVLDVKELNTRINFASGTINDSLFLAANKAGLNDNLTMELADILGWDIDFALDIRKGDQFSVVFEEKYLDDLKVSNGNILLAQFVNNGKTITAVRYEDGAGHVDYFTPEGLSMRKTFRRNPLDIVRISSRFNLKRKHPVLHKIRAHRGVDYAASTGTPIRATGDGKVITARRKGGFGKVVVIQHGQKYNTLYAHLSKYGRKVKEGRYVKQGQIIGYVGSTGLATGPHLHYEFRVNGVHRNPLTVSLPHAKPIKKEEKENFLEHSKIELARLGTFQNGQQEN